MDYEIQSRSRYFKRHSIVNIFISLASLIAGILILINSNNHRKVLIAIILFVVSILLIIYSRYLYKLSTRILNDKSLNKNV